MKMKIKIDNQDYIFFNDVMEKLKLSRSSIFTFMRFNKIPKPVKLESKMLWKLSDIETYIKNKGEEK